MFLHMCVNLGVHENLYPTELKQDGLRVLFMNYQMEKLLWSG